MAAINQQPPLFQFGGFNLNVPSLELRKHGMKLKVQRQPLQILAILLERPGEAVTREEIQNRLWPDNTYVDFDNAINSAMRKLRDALGDTAENPRFIETLARRGYRFIAPVGFVANSGGAAAQVEPAAGAAAQATAAVAKKKWIAFLPYGVCVTAIAVAALWLWDESQPGKTELVQLTEDTGLTTDPAVSPDGKLLAYASDRGSNGNLNIWIQQLGAGGAAVRLTHDSADASEPAFSPDGSRIAFCSTLGGGGIYTVPVIGGELTRLARSGKHPRFSPDGRWISYVSVATDSVLDAVGAVYLLPSSGGEPRRVGPDLLAGASPVWSPDNRHLLVYVGPKHGFTWDEADWWTISLNGTPSQRTGAFKELTRQGFLLGFDRIPQASQWTKDFIAFSAAFGDAVNAFRAPMSREGHITGPAVRLTSGTTTEISPGLSASGELIFASLNRSFGVWSLSADPDHAKITSEPKRITLDANAILPSISADGRMLAFTTARRRTRDDPDAPLMLSEDAAQMRIELKNLSTGKETFLETGDTAQWHPQISRDGSMVAYTSGKPGRIYVASVEGGRPRMIVDGQNLYAWDWSFDDRRLLFDMTDGPRVHVADVLGGHEQVLLGKRGYGLFQAKFSPDDRALALIGCWSTAEDPPQCQVFIAPIESGTPVPPERWIAIDHAGRWDDKPRWSPNGELIYFISDRDSHLCLWAQRVESQSKQLIGTPFPVYHSHSSRLAMANVDPGLLEFDVARDKIVLGLGGLTGNIWSLRKK